MKTCPNKYQKSSLRAYNTVEQSFAASGNLVFNNTGYKSGVSIDLSTDGTTIYLNTPGLYFVTLNADLTNETANTETIVQMLKDGIAVTGAYADATITAIGNIIPTTISAIVSVSNKCACCMESGKVTFQVSGTTAVVESANVNVIRLA